MVGSTLCRETFTGEQAVSWITAVGQASSHDEAVELCSRLLRAGYIKQVQGRDAFVASSSELYKFVFLKGDLSSAYATQPEGQEAKPAKLVRCVLRSASGAAAAAKGRQPGLCVWGGTLNVAAHNAPDRG